jgi:hypothetical protein
MVAFIKFVWMLLSSRDAGRGHCMHSISVFQQKYGCCTLGIYSVLILTTYTLSIRLARHETAGLKDAKYRCDTAVLPMKYKQQPVTPSLKNS